MKKAREGKTYLGIAVDVAVVRRLDKLVEKYPAAKRTSLAREALLRGLALLEKEVR